MEGSFGFPNVDKGGTLFTCDFVYDIPGLAIDNVSNCRNFEILHNIYFDFFQCTKTETTNRAETAA